uniref:Uncharacterized protein n=1 Tax=Podoviridae sp. ct2m58 TaxID=2827721 RepID=A0A8S5TMQ0_9CAUD|nr:MAG TPA: hypothetical protein [Podoviridae sp. ct2m58]
MIYLILSSSYLQTIESVSSVDESFTIINSRLSYDCDKTESIAYLIVF